MNLYGKIADKISKSLVDHLGKVSSATISSYFILAQILLMGIVYLGIDVTNAVMSWKKGEQYVIPSQSIFVLGLILSHHLVLLGIKKSGDTAMYPTGYKTSETTTGVDGVTRTRDMQIGDIISAPATPVTTHVDSNVSLDVEVAADSESASPGIEDIPCDDEIIPEKPLKGGNRRG